MGNAGRRQATFPYGPLDFSDRTRIPTAHTEGAAILAELPGTEGLLLFRVLRLVVSYARGEYDRGWFDADELRAWEEELLRARGDARLFAPVAVIVGELVDPERAAMDRVSHACWCVVEWATERSPAATVAFAEAAALSWPANPRDALAAGRLIRQAGYARESEIWLRRARRLAAHYRDWECLVLSTSSLGMLHFDQGSYRLATQHLERAHRIARRHNLRTLEGEVLHNRFAVSIITGELDGAERFAQQAFERYLPFHPKLPALAYNVAYLWLSKGNAARPIPLFHALLKHFVDPEPRVQVLCALCRAAGMLRDHTLFHDCAAQTERIAEQMRGIKLPAALMDLALGAIELEEQEIATRTLERARALAEELGQADLVLRAEKLQAQLTEGYVPTARRTADAPEQDRFASSFALVLEELPPSSSCMGAA
jgi:tetratricopeptide (TPR) repeat protein